jgi:hypothetical protein
MHKLKELNYFQKIFKSQNNMVMKSIVAIAGLLLLLSCNTENKVTVEEKQSEIKDTIPQSKTAANQKNKSTEGKVPEILRQHQFFKEVKDAKSGTENETKIIVNSSYAYIEQDGKEILDGKACVDMVAMGFGSSTCANFKEGKLQGVAYETFSTPETYMLRMEFDKDELKEAAIFISNENNCLSNGSINGKSLKVIKDEFNNLLKLPASERKGFKTVDCPQEMTVLFN